uniref:Transmembrane protein 182 n=1 Tax=Xiphophorus couchianus TaxID=32473 RepID=A0A3B5MY95_9TELE
MKLSVALCFAGVFGALAAAFIFLSFGTDYWLLAVDVVHDQSSKIVSFHSGFFWSCYSGILPDAFLNTMVTKWFCERASFYSFLCSFWRIFMLISVAAVTFGGFLIICAAPFASHCLYKAGGGLFLTSGEFNPGVLNVVQTFINEQRASQCPNFTLNLSYGLSFVFAPIGIFFSLLAGLLFLLIGRTVKIQH